MPTVDQVIGAKFRDVSLQVAIAGSTTTWPVTDLQTDAQMKDTPDQISLLGGVAGRTVTFKIDHTYAAAISPYQNSPVPAAYPLPIGATVVVSVSFWLSASRIAPAFYTSTIFTGYVTDINPIDAVSDITVTAQDVSFNLGQNVSLPSAGVLPPFADAAVLDLYYSPLVVIDLLLRGCGIYLTLPPVLGSASLRSTFQVLSIPGYGGNVPDIGQVVNAFAATTIPPVPSSRTVGQFAPDVVGSSYSTYEMTQTISGVTDHRSLRIEAFLKVSGSGAATICAGGVGGGSHPNIGVNGSGQIFAGARGQTTFTASNASILDGAWHYFYVETRGTSGNFQIFIKVDGNLYTSTAEGLAATPFLGTIGDGATFVVGGPSNTAIIWLELLEVIFQPIGNGIFSIGDHYGDTPSTVATVTATTARLQAIAPQTGLNAWQTVQSVAAAEGALCWFDELGALFFEPRATWLARRTAASVATYGPDSTKNFGLSITANGIRKNVTANYSTVFALASTAAAPAYQADAVLTFGIGVTTTPIATDQRFFNPAPGAIGASNVVGNCWFVPVRAAMVGDPSAPVLGNVRIVVVPTATGFNLTVANPNGFAISFWNPTAGTIPQGPALVVHGTRILTGDPVNVSYLGNPFATDDLALDDNPWRQDLTTTQRLVYTAAMDTYNAIPVFANIDVPGDPRRRLGDVITVVSPIIPGGVACVVVDIAHNFSSGSDYRMVLGIRPLGAVTGWLAGVTGRAEADTTTYAPLP